ncbi:hypothetical protein [Rhodovastum atsumiense]|nr:hypothetical protein [Rhodovastum atsumiense]
MITTTGILATAGVAGGLGRAKGATANEQRKPLPRLPIGMNLSGIADYDPGFPFRNLMWGARPWLTTNLECCGPWDTEQIAHFELDANGYPLEAPIRVPASSEWQVPFTVLPNVRRPGRYVLLHEGTGSFAGVMNTTVLSAQPGRVLLDMKHNPTLLEGIVITRSKRGDHVRNIRIVAIEDEKADLAANPFLPEFLDFCRSFHCLRFMDWAVTNGSLEEEWGRRKRPDFYTMVGISGDPDGTWGPPPSAFDYRFSGGVAIEVMLELANMLGVAPWLCIPHRASDEYIAEYARLTRAKLDPRLPIYLEYSNELWNWGFIQSHWMLRSTLAGDMVKAKGVQPWEDEGTRAGTAHPERIGALFRRAFAIWEREWTGRDRARLVRACTVQHAYIDAARRTAEWCARNGGADVLAPGGYFGPGEVEYAAWAAKGAKLSADDVIADMRRVLKRDTMPWTRAQAGIAQVYGLGYAVYEGGQHLQPANQEELPYNPALAAAQVNPGMYDLYVEDLRLHQEIGCRLFCAYSSVSQQGTRYGSWGAKASYLQPLAQAPKMRALLECNTQRVATSRPGGRAAYE